MRLYKTHLKAESYIVKLKSRIKVKKRRIKKAGQIACPAFNCDLTSTRYKDKYLIHQQIRRI